MQREQLKGMPLWSFSPAAAAAPASASASSGKRLAASPPSASEVVVGAGLSSGKTHVILRSNPKAYAAHAPCRQGHVIPCAQETPEGHHGDFHALKCRYNGSPLRRAPTRGERACQETRHPLSRH